MRLTFSLKYLSFFCLLILLNAYRLSADAFYSVSSSMKQAQAYTEQAIKSLSYEEQLTALNQALSVYLLVEQQLGYAPASLDQIIGDHYFYLNEYPLAIFYYARATKKDPTEKIYALRLQNTQKLWGTFLSAKEIYWQEKLFHLFAYFSTKSFQILYVFGFLTFIIFSLLIWLSTKLIYRLLFYHTVFFTLFFIFLGCAYYLIPLEAIIVDNLAHPLSLTNLTYSSATPLLGIKVRILKLLPHDYVKVIDEKGQSYEIPAYFIKLL